MVYDQIPNVWHKEFLWKMKYEAMARRVRQCKHQRQNSKQSERQIVVLTWGRSQGYPILGMPVWTTGFLLHNVTKYKNSPQMTASKDQEEV